MWVTSDLASFVRVTVRRYYISKIFNYQIFLCLLKTILETIIQFYIML